jgi:hypothetical protein
VSLDERPRGSTRPTPKVHYNSLPRTSIEGALDRIRSVEDLLGNPDYYSDSETRCSSRERATALVRLSTSSFRKMP